MYRLEGQCGKYVFFEIIPEALRRIRLQTDVFVHVQGMDAVPGRAYFCKAARNSFCEGPLQIEY